MKNWFLNRADIKILYRKLRMLNSFIMIDKIMQRYTFMNIIYFVI